MLVCCCVPSSAGAACHLPWLKCAVTGEGAARVLTDACMTTARGRLLVGVQHVKLQLQLLAAAVEHCHSAQRPMIPTQAPGLTQILLMEPWPLLADPVPNVSM